ncbi:hypothetical protein FACS189419_02570 [Planctomycetales bacterium]|nr:hypothetical protein FACS189419_02570 [Planctomycetales bacterium]
MEKITVKEWVENWKRVGPVLEQLKAEEMRSPDYEKQLAEFGTMLNWACEHALPRLSSGLAEQQYYFSKARTNDGEKNK